MGTQQHYDVVIVGSGLAGMTAALSVADTKQVALISKGQLLSGSSDWAQGGIAAVMDADDSIHNHYLDTMVAGANLGEADAVQFVVENAPNSIAWLKDAGVPFTMEGEALHLTREGGHSHRRIVHAADATGHAIQSTLIKKVLAHPNITVLEHHIAVDLITGKHLAHAGEQLSNADLHRCYGVYVLDTQTEQVHAVAGAQTVLATGGAGKVYLYTTNPDSASGDGIAMAWRAGCRVANMEFMQFHPTCLFHPHAKSFLISEALRGEGGILRLPAKVGEPANSGYRFMYDHDERGELAPRDVVARAIDFEIKRHGLDCVVLDMTHKEPAFLQAHFPMIFARCLELGIDMRVTPIPVVPATHYTCGGVVTDLSGKTDIANLYAIGEVTYTGLHGANRLASNSLLECVVFGQSCARDILQQTDVSIKSAPAWDASRVTNADEEVVISHNWDELRRFMWNYVGIVRTNKRLERAARRIELLKGEIDEFYKHFRVTSDLLELRNLVTCADLIVKCAMYRHESRGLHYSLDYPNTAPKAMPTVLSPKV
jgi:L-aspartate oxidase